MPRHAETERKPHARHRQAWLMPMMTALLTVAASLLATVLWTLPNWTLFRTHVTHFPELWQLESNRRLIMLLTIKVLSPLLIAPIIVICCWLIRSIGSLVSESAAGESGEPILTRQIRQPSQGGQREISVMSSPAFPARQSSPEKAAASPVRSILIPQQTESAALTQPVSFPLEAAPKPRVGLPLPTSSAPPLDLPQLSQDLLPPSESHESISARPEQLTDRTAPPLSPPDASAGGNNLPISAASSSGFSAVHVPTGEPPVLDQGREGPCGEYVRIRLLKEVQLELVAPDGRCVQVPLVPNAKRIQLLAYLAWLRGEEVSREKLLEDVFGHGLSDEEATPKRLGEAFDSHRKFLRKDVREAIARLNAAAGQELIPPNLDVFSTRQGLWRLAPTCRVIDLAVLSQGHPSLLSPFPPDRDHSPPPVHLIQA
ncbi:hypothetical protein A4R35_23520 [Thermogemmatispora tikiterensis]|uniref:OmpR/PhoB-type domain-containing protein n=1 Tax=Thermogemmatispora tikiterensis TaxID=1825093 RepID=A0A328VS27_9CHLR|nr:hypothetical protein A4R35_23520 [Thermogemmatispora tikiterensis]